MATPTFGMESSTVPRFERRLLSSEVPMTRIGDGSLGGKAHGLIRVAGALSRELGEGRFPWVTVSIPRTTVISTQMFDAFMERNDLYGLATSDAPDERIAHAFQRADLPAELVGDLRAIAEEVTIPLAVRSSSLLEDAIYQPFAGVYATKMIPNNQPSKDMRFQRLVEAVKFVFSSTFFAAARQYLRSLDKSFSDEKMAVMIQEVVGKRVGDRFYPTISGVLRSHNYYPSGHGRPEDGVCSLALGLGRAIVTGEPTWSFSPAYPKAPPPFNSIGDMLKNTQTRFWAVNMGPCRRPDPIRETECLVHADLSDAEYDQTLRFVASTYDARSDRIVPGVGAKGPRVIDFAPLLSDRELAAVEVFKSMLEAGRKELEAEVEIEFAMTLDRKHGRPARIGFLQVRPMVVSSQPVDLAEDGFDPEDVVVASDHTLGNGIRKSIRDIVYLVPELFRPDATPTIAREVEAINQSLVEERRGYLLIGFGRWGTSDPWAGVPVAWGQVAGAEAIVEAALPGMNVEMSQGSHFFHNVTSFQVLYFSVPLTGKEIDWQWLASRPAVRETDHVRHVRLQEPIEVRVDGKRGKGVVLRNESGKRRR